MTDLNISMPRSSQVASYNPELARDRYQQNKELIADQYHYEKFIGRRMPNGAKKLQSLAPAHKQYIAAYVNGMKGVEIAAQYDVAAITVYRVLADPLARDLIEEFDDGFKDEFRAMFPLVADAVREGLESGSPGTKLKAVDRWTKVCRLLDGNPEDEGEAKKLDTVFAARMRFVELVKSAQTAAEAAPAGSETLIDVEVVEAAAG